MIAVRVGAARLPRVKWTARADRSLDELMRFPGSNRYGDPEARRLEIKQAIEVLRYAPFRCAVVAVRMGRSYRRLIVAGRFFVYYIYTAPRGMASSGTLSIRAVKHGAGARPFLGVREASPDELAPDLSSGGRITPASCVGL